MAVAVADYDVAMRKHRVQLELDEDVIDTLKEVAEDELNMSVIANAVLRNAFQHEAHRKAGLRWLEELYEQHGRPTPEQYARAREFVDDLMGRSENGKDEA